MCDIIEDFRVNRFGQKEQENFGVSPHSNNMCLFIFLFLKIPA